MTLGKDLKEVDKFISKLDLTPVKKSSNKSRLFFGLDATASREHTWDAASHIQVNMFDVVSKLGGINIQVGCYRGYKEFLVSNWASHSSELISFMTKISCRSGHTQINRILSHILKESANNKVNASIFIGDSIEENPSEILKIGGKLSLLGIPLFIFQEGNNPLATEVFVSLAKITRGAHCNFDNNSPERLEKLLEAVAIYASGGKEAIKRFSRLNGEDLNVITKRLIK
ncbi:VWA domain-containing protein [Alphaproteobacteria bacterium]|nr:VWA domain-containing protein [Alphaproteobacteria bacterium]